MKDLMIFLLRGALGAIIGSISFALIFSLYIRYFLLLIVALIPVALAIEGAYGMLIGFVCWVSAGGERRLNVLVRVAIGTGITWVALLALYLYPLVTARENFSGFSVIEIFQFHLFLLVVSLSIGGAAGMACPALREQVSEESKLTYRERLRLDEAAEREAKEARQRIESVQPLEKSILTDSCRGVRR